MNSKMHVLTKLVCAGMLLGLAAHTAIAQTRAQLDSVLEDRFSWIDSPVAMAKWNAAKCSDFGTISEMDAMVASLALKAGVDPGVAKRLVEAEQDRCCEIRGQWQKGACDKAELDKRIASAKVSIGNIETIIALRDAAH